MVTKTRKAISKQAMAASKEAGKQANSNAYTSASVMGKMREATLGHYFQWNSVHAHCTMPRAGVLFWDKSNSSKAVPSGAARLHKNSRT